MKAYLNAFILSLLVLAAGCRSTQPVDITPQPAVEAPRVCLFPAEPGGLQERLAESAWATVETYQPSGAVTAQRLPQTTASPWAETADCALMVLPAGETAERYLLETRNHERPFLLLGQAPPPGMDLGRGLVFHPSQPAYLAGYLAAGVSQTGSVGIFGASAEEETTAVMSAFFEGVQQYNQQHNGQVSVLGWDAGAQSGLLTGGEDLRPDGVTLARTLLNRQADVLFPVSGISAFGALEAASQQASARVVGFDLDLDLLTGADRSTLLASVQRLPEQAVRAALDDFLRGSFQGGVFEGTLQNGAVELQVLSSSIPAEVSAGMDRLRADITADRLQVSPGSAQDSAPES